MANSAPRAPPAAPGGVTAGMKFTRWPPAVAVAGGGLAASGLPLTAGVENRMRGADVTALPKWSKAPAVSVTAVATESDTVDEVTGTTCDGAPSVFVRVNVAVVQGGCEQLLG